MDVVGRLVLVLMGCSSGEAAVTDRPLTLRLSVSEETALTSSARWRKAEPSVN